MAKRVTTLFIRDTSINLLVMKGGQVEKWASLPLEPGLVSQGLIVDEAQVAVNVKQIFKETGAKTKKVITALSGYDSLYRIITLPDLPEAVLPEAIRREARRTIPTPLEEVYFSYQRLPTLTKGEGRIFLVTFPRNLVDALIRTLHQAGVKPYVLDLAPLALCRIPNEPRAIIVNARLDYLEVAVITDRLPQVIRRLSLPGEAESLEERLPLIAEEFNRTVSFYNSGHIERPLDSNVPVFVCGDLAEVPERWETVVSQAGYSVSLLPLPVEPPEGFNPNEFMVNIGLALKELLVEKEGADFSIVNFNALPEAYIPPSFSIVRVLVPVGTVIGIGLIVFGVIFVLDNRTQIASLQSQLETYETEADQLREDIKDLNKQIGLIGPAAGELSKRLGDMEKGRVKVDTDLAEIKAKAGQVTLSSVVHGIGSVTVKGTASNEGAIFSYADALRDLEETKGSLRFSKVWIKSISGGGGAFSFEIYLQNKF